MSIVIGNNTKIKNSIIGRDKIKKKLKIHDKQIDNCIDDMFYLRDCLIWKLEQRIDNAIKYIENSDKYDFSKCELLDILKGSDKE